MSQCCRISCIDVREDRGIGHEDREPISVRRKYYGNGRELQRVLLPCNSCRIATLRHGGCYRAKPRYRSRSWDESHLELLACSLAGDKSWAVVWLQDKWAVCSRSGAPFRSGEAASRSICQGDLFEKLST